MIFSEQIVMNFIAPIYFSSVLLFVQINLTDSASKVEFCIQHPLYAEAIQSGVSQGLSTGKLTGCEDNFALLVLAFLDKMKLLAKK